MAIRRWVFQGAEAHFVDEGTFPSHRANLALLPLDESHFDACPLCGRRAVAAPTNDKGWVKNFVFYLNRAD
jgi:hypothetical protein